MFEFCAPCSGLVHTAELHPDERLGQGEAQGVHPGVQGLPGPTYGHRPPGALTACGAPGHCCTLDEVSMALRMSPPLEYTDYTCFPFFHFFTINSRFIASLFNKMLFMLFVCKLCKPPGHPWRKCHRLQRKAAIKHRRKMQK